MSVLIEDLVTSREAGLVGCRRCGRVWPSDTSRCERCGGALKSRDDHSLQRVWAWWIAGIMAYIPANLYPMLETRLLFRTESSTIIGGAIDLASHGAVGIAVVILVASVLIPLGKFFAIAYLALSVRRESHMSAIGRQRVFEIVLEHPLEKSAFRWSMIDVFVVAILASLVQLNVAASISPGMASLAFALSVIFTMLSAQSFDSRMIWDRQEEALGSAGR